MTTRMRSAGKVPSAASSTRPNRRRLSAARASTPRRRASRVLSEWNGLAGMMAQQSIRN